MNTLLALSAGLTLAVVWLLVRPLLRPATAANEERHVQLRLVRDRLLAQLNELEVETGDRNLDAETARDERARLEAELAGVLRELEGPARGEASGAKLSGRQGAFLLVALGVLVPALAGGFYLVNRTPVPTEGAGDMPAMVQAMVERLEKRLQENPADPAGWARLGRSYAVMGRLDAAQAAFARAYKLAPKDVDILAEYAWLLYSQDPSNTKGLVGRLYRELGQLQPDHPRVLWFRGFEAYQRKDFRSAVQQWERLLAQMPAGSEEAEHLSRAVSAAREQMRPR